jgi:hypothetical protein
MYAFRTLRRVGAGVLLSAGIAVSGSSLAAVTADAQPGPAPLTTGPAVPRSTHKVRATGARGSPCHRPAITSPTRCVGTTTSATRTTT